MASVDQSDFDGLINLALDKSQSLEVREMAISSLGQSRDELAIIPLVTILADSSNENTIRSDAANALEELLDDSDMHANMDYDVFNPKLLTLVPMLINIALDRSEANNVRTVSVELLNMSGDSEISRPLIVILSDKSNDDKVRSAAALPLGWPSYRTEESISTLIAVLGDLSNSTKVRARSAWGLREARDQRAVEVLLEALTESEPEVVSQSALALGEIGDKRAVEPLIGLLSRKDCYGISFALGVLGDVRAVEPLLNALTWAEPGMAQSIIGALGKIGDLRAFEPLLAMFINGGEDIKYSTASALGELGDSRAVEPLLEAFQYGIDHGSAQYGATQSVAFALGELKDPRGIKALTEALKHSESNVRWLAAMSLSRAEDKGTVAALVAVLQDESYSVRRDAAEALGKIGDISAIPALQQLLGDERTREGEESYFRAMVIPYVEEALAKLEYVRNSK